jgi:sigma-B regulation protein RsbU (phosphoserine phosphatase)
MRLEISGNPRLSCLLRKFVSQASEMAGFCENEANMITLAVDEAFTNIIRHTYQMDLGKRIYVRLFFTENDHIEIELKDDGPPLEVANIKNRCLEEIRPGGLGVHFIQSIMDTVEYLPQETMGNVVRMRKYLKNVRPGSKPMEETRKNPQLLAALLEIGQSLPWILDLDTLLNLIVKRVKNLMESEGASVILLDEARQELVFHTVLDEDENIVKKLQGLRFPANKGIAGRVLQTRKPLFVRNVEKDPDHFKGVDESTGSHTESLLYTPLQVRDRAIGILSAKNKKDGLFDDADMEALTAIAGTVSLSIDNARAHTKLLDTKRMQKELHSASLMHRATLPQSLPDVPGLLTSAICVPATEVGGDYYDFFPLADGLHAFAIGDVSGHGLEAGMMVSMTRSCLYTQLHFSHKIEDVMQAMNRMVYGSVERRLMMTFFFAIYDCQESVLTFANAGHPSPYYYAARDRQWKLIEEGEFPLGVRESHVYPIYSMQLQPGDIFVLYSDGIIEAANSHRDRYGFDRFHNLLVSQNMASPKEIQDAILRDVENFCENFSASDDRTLMVLGRKL